MLRTNIIQLIFIILGTHSGGYCQFPATVFPLPTDSVVWGYGISVWGWDYYLDQAYQYDTSHQCGHVYGVIISSETLYVRTQGDSVLARAYASCDSAEVVVIDFSAQQGDTLWLGQNLGSMQSQGFLAPYIVDSVDTIFLNNYYRRQIRLRYDKCYQNYGTWNDPWQYVYAPTYWIEGYGIVAPYPLLFGQTDCDAWEAQYCFQSMVVNHDTVWYTPCVTPIGGAESLSPALGLTAQPNPASGQTTLVVESRTNALITLSLFAPTGQCVWQQTANWVPGRNEIPMPLPGPGAYYVRAEAPGTEPVTIRIVALP